MNTESVMWIVVGLIAGWLAGSTMRGHGYGVLGDIAIAVVGAIAGVWLVLSLVPETERAGPGAPILAALLSAGAFVGVARLLTRRTASA